MQTLQQKITHNPPNWESQFCCISSRQLKEPRPEVPPAEARFHDGQVSNPRTDHETF